MSDSSLVMASKSSSVRIKGITLLGSGDEVRSTVGDCP